MELLVMQYSRFHISSVCAGFTLTFWWLLVMAVLLLLLVLLLLVLLLLVVVMLVMVVISLALLLLLLLLLLRGAGAPPFNDDTPQQIFERILDCNVEFLTDEGEHVLSEEGRDLISQLLQVGPLYI
jgi:endonuclease/exonuclease/phosphatase (EEP) superfamily protein YafD